MHVTRKLSVHPIVHSGAQGLFHPWERVGRWALFAVPADPVKPALRQDTEGRSRRVLNTLVRARALNNCRSRRVLYMCMATFTANVPIGSVILQVSPR